MSVDVVGLYYRDNMGSIGAYWWWSGTSNSTRLGIFGITPYRGIDDGLRAKSFRAEGELARRGFTAGNVSFLAVVR